jgi:hypothetical protein
MLEAAGDKLEGPGGAMRVSGLAAIYCRVFGVWLEDDTPSMDRTMAALDKRLGRAERMLSSLDAACGDLCRFACGFMPRGWKREEKREAPPATGAAPAPSP